jgi:hypothetical protein
MEICRHEGIDHDLKKLKRFISAEESLEAWERLFCLKGLKEMPSVDQCARYGERKIYKARVIALRENFGKSKGYRVIFEMTSSELCTVLVFSRHGIYQTEGELLGLVKERLR